MYELEFLPAALRDLTELALYIRASLHNPAAAERLTVELVQAAEAARAFPYAAPAYLPVRPLRREYRRLNVKNYAMFYWVEPEAERIVVARVIYAKRELSELLE